MDLIAMLRELCVEYGTQTEHTKSHNTIKKI